MGRKEDCERRLARWVSLAWGKSNRSCVNPFKYYIWAHSVRLCNSQNCYATWGCRRRYSLGVRIWGLRPSITCIQEIGRRSHRYSLSAKLQQGSQRVSTGTPSWWQRSTWEQWAWLSSISVGFQSQKTWLELGCALMQNNSPVVRTNPVTGWVVYYATSKVITNRI